MTVRLATDGATTHGARRASFYQGLGALLGGVLTLPRTWIRRRHDRQALLLLDDHLLRDIGLDRAQVEDMAACPFWRA